MQWPSFEKVVIQYSELTLWNVCLWAELAVLEPILPGTDKPLRVSHTLPATQKKNQTHSQTHHWACVHCSLCMQIVEANNESRYCSSKQEIRTATNYFFNQINCLIYKISENGEKCSSDFQRHKPASLNCLFVPTIQNSGAEPSD